MRILVGGSWITVSCALLTALWSVPQFLVTGTVTLSSHPLFVVLFLFPSQIGVPVCLLVAMNSVLLISRGRLVTTARRLLAGGQILTVVLLGVCALLLALPTTFGREFILMALAFQVGQVVVAVGLALHLHRRRRLRSHPETDDPASPVHPDT
ncbi:hypothetical protein H483_0110190 [Dietzia sp. UCD-THP]|uniref:hypothetical protein n=1 Tax=Dietzia sp. UCD-THP TaxID=1292020 RepID=UPI00036BB55A|nr:hypothetical protein [Dietzia sp. UCD-THP]EYT62571.1 hypothetical protein H483_0110190 [Dietzia sp. UCD-THP]